MKKYYKLIRPSYSHTNQEEKSSHSLISFGSLGLFKHWAIILGVVVLLLLATLQVTLAAKVATTGKEIKTLEEEKYSLSLEINALSEQIANASSINVIEKNATEKLKMVKVVENQNVVYVKSSPPLVYAQR